MFSSFLVLHLDLESILSLFLCMVLGSFLVSFFFFLMGKNAQELMLNHYAGIPNWSLHLHSKDHRTPA